MTRVEVAGGVLSGGREDGVSVFRGVPYASYRRFMPSEPVTGWRAVRHAGEFGPPVAQRPGRMAWVPGLQIDPDESREGGLTLNIWTPGCDGGRRPVLVFLHGGAFVFGSGAQAMYDGGPLARRHGLVVVTINYRLGYLGFGHDGEIPANLGLRDQLAALHWVREHVAAFGGDPSQITLAGHSAGGTSVLALMTAPRAQGLFARAAVMSALPYGFATVGQAGAVSTAVRRALGRAHPKTAPLATLLRAEGAALATRPLVEGLLPVAPVIDGEFLVRHPMEVFRTGAAARIPLLITTTAEEMRLFGAIDPPSLPHSSTRTEVVFERPAAELARTHRTPVHTPVHRVRFTHPSPLARNGVPLGACHLVDVPFHLGTLHKRQVAPLTGQGPEITTLGEATMAAFAAFCKGEPCLRETESRSSDRATSAPI